MWDYEVVERMSRSGIERVEAVITGSKGARTNPGFLSLSGFLMT
jgi:hypothetical protein